MADGSHQTEFKFEINPRDGSGWSYVSCLFDGVIVPPVGSIVGIDSDSSTSLEVVDVRIFPTCDPCVRVRLETLRPQTAADAGAIELEANAAGWSVSR